MIYFDLETTGLNGYNDDIIEIYLLKENNNGQFIAELHLYINTDKQIILYIEKLTGINNAFLKDKKYFKAVGQQIIDFIGDEILIGHNAEGFDLPFLNANLEKNGFEKLNNQVIDTMILARQIDGVDKYTRGYKLIDLCQKHCISFDEQAMHGAKYDVQMTKQLYERLQKK